MPPPFFLSASRKSGGVGVWARSKSLSLGHYRRRNLPAWTCRPVVGGACECSACPEGETPRSIRSRGYHGCREHRLRSLRQARGFYVWLLLTCGRQTVLELSLFPRKI